MNLLASNQLAGFDIFGAPFIYDLASVRWAARERSTCRLQTDTAASYFSPSAAKAKAVSYKRV